MSKMVTDESISYQITPSIASFAYVDNIDPSIYDLVFLAKDLPPLGMKCYYVEVEESEEKLLQNQLIPKESSAREYIGTEASIYFYLPTVGLKDDIKRKFPL